MANTRDQSGPKHWNWKGGMKWSMGYCYLWKPGYHRATKNYAKRSDLVLEEKIGRLLLPNEIAHHIDEDRGNDHPDNLEAQDRGAHGAERNSTGKERGIFIGCHAHQLRDNFTGRFK